jgi:GMP synthase-like glutamine amidotransferase
MTPWLVLQHVAWEAPGLIAAEAEARGLCTEVRLMNSGASIPGPNEIAGLIIMGGPILLAFSTAYPHQAFRFGRCAYGLQFHVEPDSNTWTAWRAHLPAALIAEANRRSAALEEVGKGLIARFFDLAIGQR